MKAHLVMPMGGAGSRFLNQGYIKPKPLIELHGKPFFYWATESVNRDIDLIDITFVVLKEHVRDFQIDKEIKKYYKNAQIVLLDKMLQGPVFTALCGVDSINDELPLIINDCDHMFRCAKLREELNKKELDEDGMLLTFESTSEKYSYVRYAGNCVAGTAEKKVVSNRAICGAYVFKDTHVFVSNAKQYIKECPYNECFMSGIYNVMCENNYKIKELPLDEHLEFGTPEELEVATQKKSLF